MRWPGRRRAVRKCESPRLPRSFEFIREHFFAATPTTHVPDFPQSVLDGLGTPPLTQAKRDALVTLLLDPRSEPGWTRSNRNMGDDGFRMRAVLSVNAHAGRELITYQESQALTSKTAGPAALRAVLDKIRGLGR